MASQRLWQKIGLQGKDKPNEKKRKNTIRVSRQSELGIFAKKKEQNEDQLGIFQFKKDKSDSSFPIDNNVSQILSKPMRISVTHNNQKESIVKCQSQDLNQIDMKEGIHLYNVIRTEQLNKSVSDKQKARYKETITGIRLLVLILSQENNNLKQYIQIHRKEVEKLYEKSIKQAQLSLREYVKSISCKKCSNLEQKIIQNNQSYIEMQQLYKKSQENYQLLQQKYKNCQEECKKLSSKTSNIKNQQQKVTTLKPDSRAQQKKRHKTQVQELQEQNYKIHIQLNSNQIRMQQIEKGYRMKLLTIEDHVNEITQNYNDLVEKLIEEKNIIQHEHNVMQVKLDLTMEQVELVKKQMMMKETNHREQCALLLNRIKGQKIITRNFTHDVRSSRQKHHLSPYRNHHTSLLDDIESINHSFSYINIADEFNINDSMANTHERNERNQREKRKKINQSKNFLDIQTLLSKKRNKLSNESRIRQMHRQKDSVFDKALQNLNELQRGVRMQINRCKLTNK